MEKYIVTGAVCSFNPGVILVLAPELARDRLHNLQKIDRDTYVVEQKVEFKRGTEIGFYGEVNKAMLNVLTPKEADNVDVDVATNLSEEEKQAIAAAVAQLDPKNDDHWTSDRGLPAIKAVKGILGTGAKVSRDDIEQAAPGVDRSFFSEKEGEATGVERKEVAGDKVSGDENNVHDDEDRYECLLGSSVQPSIFLLKDGTEVQLGDVVRDAFDLSGVATVDEWNALPEEESEAFIQEIVDGLDLAEDQGNAGDDWQDAEPKLNV